MFVGYYYFYLVAFFNLTLLNLKKNKKKKYEFLNYGGDATSGLQFKLPQRVSTLTELPFINRTTYRDDFVKLQLGNNNRPAFPKIANPLYIN